MSCAQPLANRSTSWLGKCQLKRSGFFTSVFGRNIAGSGVDNTLKVTLDALCGPAGVLINDCQVQHVFCHWIDWTQEDQQFTVVVKHRPDEWIRKKGLVFVEVVNGLCWPINLGLPAAANELVMESMARMSDASRKLLELTGDWHLAQLVMPIQRPFHRGRLREFRVLSPAEARREIGL